MSTRSASRLFALVGVLLLLMIGYVCRDLGWTPFTRYVRADQCIRCAAVRTKKGREAKLFGARLEYARKEYILVTPLTEVWKRYGGDCAHEWAFKYFNGFHGGKKTFADGFPSFRHPATRNPARLASCVERLPDNKVRLLALSAITDQSNWLRFVAARALNDIADEPQSDTAAWWESHSNYFKVETNMVAANAILQQWEGHPDHLFDFEIDECLESIRRVEAGSRP